MSIPKSVIKLAKLLHYMLGCRPDEFGLVPDQRGFVPTKELLKALAEEKGWKHVRQAHLNEIALTLPSAPIEIKRNHIRARTRDRLPRPMQAIKPPKTLFACVRKRAHPVVMQNGLAPTRHEHVVLAADAGMAERIGKRRDPSPVLLHIHVPQSIARGVLYHQFGENLFLASPIPPECISGPTLPKETPEAKKQVIEPTAPKRPGSFYLNKERLDPTPHTITGRKKKRDKTVHWKKDRKRIRRRKEKMWDE